MIDATMTWWQALCTVACLNVLFWCFSLRRVLRRSGADAAHERDYRRLQLLLSAVYVAGCAWRSVLPVFDVPRLTLVDSWASSVAVGRSVATVAELAFAAQWALLLAHAARASGSAVAGFAARSIMPLILTAEVCSWHAVLTTANLGHVAEESLWGAAAALLVLGLLAAARGFDPRVRTFAIACGAAGAAYVAYMVAVDVPMYWARWTAEQALGRQPLDLGTGLADAASRWTVSHRWEDWRSEVVWMTLYFSVAVWISIGLAHAPSWRRADAAPSDARRPLRALPRA